MSYYPNYKRTFKFAVPFSASFTKFKQFGECERKYALSTYGSWDAGAAALGINIDDQIEIKRLKKIDTLDIVLGTAVHEVMAYTARKKKEGTLDIDKCTEENIAIGIKNKYENMKNKAIKATEDALKGMVPGSDEKILNELYFDNEDAKIQQKHFQEKQIKIMNKLNQIVKGIYNSDIYNELLSHDTEIKLIEVSKFPNIKLFDTIIYANIDLAYEFKYSKNEIIVDWKTGTPDYKNERSQLVLYALFLAEKFYNGDYSKVSNVFYINEYLASGKRYTHIVSEKDIIEFKETLKYNIDILRSKLKDPDKNIPFNIIEFRKAEKDSICKCCEMRNVCGRMGE
ncbi:PD-(D/E)XK nuclease family protein [Clostridium sp. DJ247]|uniref:PD-(D/E)XK nuclease family protein n=1 Tax=Clostridium sp. DJ247 TaxID=2726188 RepID=UPI001623CF9E|nr:PD-(D/E)XK nuclease family protein [Clostridium sp. DJ247]MBC2582286.1 PD-(D/E)XK nuclease family protein [Clostridium sp. DJ247]